MMRFPFKNFDSKAFAIFLVIMIFFTIFLWSVIGFGVLIMLLAVRKFFASRWRETV